MVPVHQLERDRDRDPERATAHPSQRPLHGCPPSRATQPFPLLFPLLDLDVRAERRREADQLARRTLGARRRRVVVDDARRHRDPELGQRHATRSNARGDHTLAIEVPQLTPGAEADPTIGAYGIGAAEPEWHRVTVRAGQSLADIFHENNLSPADLQRALNSQDDASALRHIHPGDEFAFVEDANGALTAMRFDRGDAARVTLHFTPEGVTESVDERVVERRTQVAHGVLTHSLYEAGAHAGMSDTMIWKLANAFGYDIDFAQDLREGDSFSVIYDEIGRAHV